MKKAFKICSIIDLVKSIAELLGGIALAIVGATGLAGAAEKEQELRLKAAGLLLLGAVLITISLCAFYWLSSFRKEEAKTERYDFKIVMKYSILAIIFAQMPTAVCSLVSRKRRKEAERESHPTAVNELFAEERPTHSEGYDAETRTIVRMVPTRNKKAYQTRGIEDIGSKNNWKGWLYLAPVIILVAIFLIYPLINTIFISFTENYKV